MLTTQPIFTDCPNCGTADHLDYDCPCECHRRGTTTHTVTYTSTLNVFPTVSHYTSDQEAHDAAYHFLECGQYNRAVGTCDETAEQVFEMRRTAVRIADANARLWHVEVVGDVS